jgi:Tfp pilus assembly protein PilF
MDESEINDLTEEALLALDDGKHVRALALADQLIAAQPDNPTARCIRAQALLKSGAGEDAVDEARLAVELDPESEQAQTILGIAAWRTGKLTLAQSSLEEAIRLSGRRPGLLVDYAWFMASERGPRPALDAALEATRAAGGSSTAWAALGLAQFRLHRREEAETSLRKALELDPNDPYAQSAMATLLQDKAQDNQAVALTHLLEDVPGTEEIVAGVRQEAKRRQVAKKLVEREALPDAVFEVTVRRWFWPVLAAALVGLMWYGIRPESLATLLPTVVIPLLLVWIAYRLFA